MPKKWKVKLRSDQRKKLLRIVHAGKPKSARREACMHRSCSKRPKAGMMRTSPMRLRHQPKPFNAHDNVLSKRAYAALTEEQRPGQPTKLTSEQKILLIALACSTPPAGFQRWTVRLLTSEAIARQILKKRTQALASRKLVSRRHHTRLHRVHERRCGTVRPAV